MKKEIAEYRKLIKSTEYQNVIKFKNLKRLLQLCEINETELLETIITYENDLTFELIFVKQDNKVFNKIMDDFTIKFVNHMGTIYLLKENIRKLHANNVKNGIEIENYDVKIKETFSDNNLIQFVNELRNHCIHVMIPKFTYFTSANEHNKKVQYFGLSKNDLLLEGKWNRKSQDFINSYDHSIPIRISLEEYGIIQNRFYEWYIGEYSSIIKEQIVLVEDAIKTISRVIPINCIVSPFVNTVFY